jgi:hypothetical protein
MSLNRSKINAKSAFSAFKEEAKQFAFFLMGRQPSLAIA